MKKLKIILILSFVLISQISFGQEKLPNFQLSIQEEEAINSGSKIIRESRTYTDGDNQICKGGVELVKIDGKIDFNQIGPWYHYYKDGSVKDIYIFDDKGYLRKYDFYEKDGFNFYSCTYSFKKIDDLKYRVEQYKIFYLSGELREEGFRYNKIEYENGIVKRSSPRNVGVRNFYSDEGELVKQKKRRLKLAKKLEILN